MNDTVKKPNGQLTIFVRRQDGSVETVRRMTNVVVYQGADALAAMAAGKIACGINAGYFEEGPDTYAVATPDRTRAAAYYQSLPTDGVLRREPAVSMTANTTSDADKYAANKATITAMTSQIAAGSYLHAVGLVCAPQWADVSEDLLFSATVLKDGEGNPAPISGIANASLGFVWTITFE